MSTPPTLSETLTVQVNPHNVWISVALTTFVTLLSIAAVMAEFLFGVPGPVVILYMLMAAVSAAGSVIVVIDRHKPLLHYDIRAGRIQTPIVFGSWARVYPNPDYGEVLVVSGDRIVAVDSSTGRYRDLPFRRRSAADGEWDTLLAAVRQRSTPDTAQ